MKFNKLKDKRVLFLSWSFYQYPQMIKETMEKYGAHVDFYNSAPTDNFLRMKLFKKLKLIKTLYYQRILNIINKEKYDYIFMINAGAFSKKFIIDLLNSHSESIKILYSWDSISVFPQTLELSRYFNRVFSFDKDDTLKYKKLFFLPLFFNDKLYISRTDNNSNKEQKYDFCFVGFAHTDRYRFIKKIEKYAMDNNYSFYFKLYLPSKLHYLRGKYVTGIFKKAKMSDFIFKPLSQEQIEDVIQESRIVLDLELNTQSGLTMRTIETHGMKKKMITTNYHIKDYDFYDSNNILVVERNDPRIPQDFMEKEYKLLQSECYDNYSLSKWVERIFS